MQSCKAVRRAKLNYPFPLWMMDAFIALPYLIYSTGRTEEGEGDKSKNSLKSVSLMKKVLLFTKSCRRLIVLLCPTGEENRNWIMCSAVDPYAWPKSTPNLLNEGGKQPRVTRATLETSKFIVKCVKCVCRDVFPPTESWISAFYLEYWTFLGIVNTVSLKGWIIKSITGALCWL